MNNVLRLAQHTRESTRKSADRGKVFRVFPRVVVSKVFPPARVSMRASISHREALAFRD